MMDVAQILSQIEQGDPSAAEQWLPLVCDDLSRFATAKLAQGKRSQAFEARTNSQAVPINTRKASIRL